MQNIPETSVPNHEKAQPLHTDYDAGGIGY